jgi:hypothetical protein
LFVCCFVLFCFVLFCFFFDREQAIVPAIFKYAGVYDRLAGIASEKLDATGPNVVVQHANAVSKLQGEYAETILKSFVAAAEPVIEKGVTTMANIRDIVLAVGPEGVQDKYGWVG